MEQTTFKTGELLFREGTGATSLFLIKVGRVSIRKKGDPGYIEIAQIGPNQIIGEIGFFDKRTRSADAVALTYCEVVEIPYDSLRPMFDPAPDYLKKIMVGLATRLRDADEAIRELKVRLGDTQSIVKSEDAELADDETETSRILKQTRD